MISAAHAILGRMMLAFEGEQVPDWMAARLRSAPAAGVTLFPSLNVRSPAQVRDLTNALQHATADFPAPFLVAADQEGGQLIGLGTDTTAFAGNMALGAVDDVALTEAVGAAIGREARAMGVNVVYAPVLDLASEPANAALGTRSFGDDPGLVARHGVAFIRGLQSAGVAASAKHFPGHGEMAQDPHHALGVVELSRADLEQRTLVPFRAAIQAGVKVTMSGHVAVPALTGDTTLPCTLSRAAMHDLLRTELGFDGLSISDALDMHAIAQGAAQAVEVIAAVRGGLDLLLCTADREAQERIEATLVAATSRRLFEPDEMAASTTRLRALRRWLTEAGPAPELDVVGGDEHRALSRTLAERALTRLGDADRPVRFERSTRLLAIMPEPRELTPADTSSLVEPGLGRALRTRFDTVQEVIVDVAPGHKAIEGLRRRAAGGEIDAVVIGTIEAHRQPAQAELVRALAATGTPTVAVAMRTPWDASIYPADVPAIATYSIHPDPLEALARALAGEIPTPGRSPVRIGSERVGPMAGAARP
jgi:beta-N-acetylhexosaminidase